MQHTHYEILPDEGKYCPRLNLSGGRFQNVEVSAPLRTVSKVVERDLQKCSKIGFYFECIEIYPYLYLLATDESTVIIV